MSKRALFLMFLVTFATGDHADAHCRVMAECGEDVIWQELGGGPPGEQGPRGPKGDPGPAVNMTEFLQELENDRKKHEGPFLHFYTQTLTWNSAKAFCRSLNKKLCNSAELCFRDGEGGRTLIPDLMAGDHWVPVIDDSNQWLEAGDSIGRTCKLHSELGHRPSWGTSTVSKPYKGYVYCCEPGNEELDVKYRYIGKTANYQKSEDHCDQLGRRLCYVSEVCKNNVPIFGVIRGDQWVAVKDKENEWVEVGNDLGRTCWVHGPRYGPPPWGVRTSGEVDHVGYVLCCPNKSSL